jgi:hypothetical protein
MLKMDHLSRTDGMRRQGNYMMMFKLENQFFHVKLAAAAYKYFGFAVTNENGEERFYCFTIMVHGYAPATVAVTRVVRPR